MPILTSDLQYLKSTNDLGGVVTTTPLIDGGVNALFDTVSAAESLTGMTDYRCFYVKNAHTSLPLENAQILLTANTPSPSSNMFIGLGSAAINGTEQAIPNETTAPSGIVFTDLIGETGLITIGAIPPNGTKSIWLKRVLLPNATASASDGVTVSLQGSTAA